jgi:hypothetical protein
MRVIPPFFAALLMPQSAEPPKIERTVTVLATPHLLPTGFEVAATGVVVAQLEAQHAIAMPSTSFISFFMLNENNDW